MHAELLGQNLDKLPDEELLLEELLEDDELELEEEELDDDELEDELLDDEELEEELLEEELPLVEVLPPQEASIRVSARAKQPPRNLGWVRMVWFPVVIDL